MRYRFMLSYVVASVIAIFSHPAGAAIRYDFTALSSFAGYSGSFSAIVPTYITVDTLIPVGSLLSCNSVGPSGPLSCGGQQFDIHPGQALDSISFGADAGGVGGVGAIGVFYSFNSGDFNVLGTHFTQTFGASQAGTLVVSSVSAIPEPATWASLFAGLGVLGFASRRRKRNEV